MPPASELHDCFGIQAADLQWLCFCKHHLNKEGQTLTVLHLQSAWTQNSMGYTSYNKLLSVYDVNGIAGSGLKDTVSLAIAPAA